MSVVMIMELPRYECLLQAAQEFPDLDPSATEEFLHLMRMGQEAARVVEAHLARHRISQGRFAVLMALWMQSRRRDQPDASLTPAELADRTGVTRATMTGLIDTLEKAGLVKRVQHPGRPSHAFGRVDRERPKSAGRNSPATFSRDGLLDAAVE